MGRGGGPVQLELITKKERSLIKDSFLERFKLQKCMKQYGSKKMYMDKNVEKYNESINQIQTYFLSLPLALNFLSSYFLLNLCALLYTAYSKKEYCDRYQLFPIIYPEEPLNQILN